MNFVISKIKIYYDFIIFIIRTQEVWIFFKKKMTLYLKHYFYYFSKFPKISLIFQIKNLNVVLYEYDYYYTFLNSIKKQGKSQFQTLN